MKRPCPIVLNRCGGQDSPITNTTSEDPDPILFSGIGWTQFDPWAIPPIGDGPQQKVDCSDIVWSDVSQVMADLLAQINAAFCQPPPVPPLPPMPDIPPMPTFPPLPTGGASVLACNDAQTITVGCFDGTQQTFNIPEGIACETVPVAYVSEYKAFINDWLKNWYTVQALSNCPGEMDSLQVCANDRQEASVECPDGSVFSAAIEAGTVTSPPLPSSLCAAWIEYANATLLAQLLQGIYNAKVCTDIPNITQRTPPGVPPGPPVPNPRLASYPGWCCLGAILDPSLNTYNLSGAGNSSWTFSISGQVPPGTFLNQTGPRSAVLDGLPSIPGTYHYTITATSGSSTVTITDTLHVFGVTPATLPDATVGVPYSEQLVGDGGTGTITFSEEGTWPSGLSMTSSGLISGIPLAASTAPVQVKIVDETGGECVQDITLNVMVGCVPETSPNKSGTLSCVRPSSLSISNWNTDKLLLVAPTADPALGEPEWDGTLPVLYDVFYPFIVSWYPVGTSPPVFVSFAFNGLHGENGGIVLLGAVASNWTLSLLGTVGGIPTTIWQGIKTTGENPIGTYMQDTGGTPGIATGPACFHVTGPTTPHALAWWPMETNPWAEVDSAFGLILTASVTNPHITHVAGHVGPFAIRYSCSGTVDFFSTCHNASLVIPSTGITVAFWVNITYNVSDPGNNGTRIFYDFYSGGLFHQIQLTAFEGGPWELTIDGGAPISKAVAAGWQFVVITYNPTSGILGLDVNQGGIATAGFTAYSQDVNANTGITIGNTTITPGDMFSDFDEVAIYNGILTPAQLNCIYNAGAGRTY